ncbi:MAG: LysE family transporter [Spirochaetes bacterium]|nr:LysE family transporter [Spirochaetota bacterium]
MNWTAFFSFVFVTTFTPGPNNIMSTTLGKQFVYKKALPFILGVGTGFLTIMLLCSFFAEVIYRYLPGIKTPVGILGALYMLYLAYKILKSKTKTQEENNGELHFYHGVIMQYLNPKGIFYGLTVTSTFIVPHFKETAVIILLAMLLAVISITSCSTWALFGAVFHKLLKRPFIQKSFNIIMALLLVYCAYSISGLDKLFQNGG